MPLFGTGFGAYKYSFLLYDTDIGGKWSTNAHNEYIETLTDGGVTGFAIGIIMLGLLIYSIIKMWKKRLFPKEGEEIKVMLNDEIHKVKVLKIFENYIEVLNDKRILKINSGEIII